MLETAPYFSWGPWIGKSAMGTERRGARLLVGLGLLACSSERLVAGGDAPARQDGGPTDVLSSDAVVCPGASLGPTEEGSARYTVAWTFSAATTADAGAPGADEGATDSAGSPSR